MLDLIINLTQQYQTIFLWISIISLIIFVFTLLITPYLLGLIPQYYFTDKYTHKIKIRHISYTILIIIRTIIGLLLVVTGVIMLVTPGQGIVSILLGLFLMEFPGKRRLELKLINHNPTFNTLNWLRKKAGKYPFKR